MFRSVFLRSPPRRLGRFSRCRPENTTFNGSLKNNAPIDPPNASLQSYHQIGFKVKAPDEIVVGNWRDEKFLEGRLFDTVLMDYLVGAIDGFAPYYQVPYGGMVR